jgi:hypothetical protein
MNIKIDNHTDAFTLHVYNSINPNVRASLTPTQTHAIETAIRANKPYQKHPIDLRGAFPLFFARFYFVFLMGRDRRQRVKEKEAARRKSTVLGSALISVYLLICMLMPIIGLVLYALKSLIGIDLFEGIHLSDLVPTLQ